jgi:ribosome-binding protein aMBF1 (putative translation factor)
MSVSVEEYDLARDYIRLLHYCPVCGVKFESMWDRYKPVSKTNPFINDSEMRVCKKCYKELSK